MPKISDPVSKNRKKIFHVFGLYVLCKRVEEGCAIIFGPSKGSRWANY